MIPAIVSGLLAQRFAAKEGLADSNKYLLLGWVLGSRPIGLGITLALANQEAEQLPPPPTTTTVVPLTITTSSLPEATVDTPYTATLVATGGQPPYAWTETSGNLPKSLPLIASTGIISGTPVAGDEDTLDLTMRVSDATGATKDKVFQLTINPKKTFVK